MPEPTLPSIPYDTTTKDVRSPVTRKRQGYFNPATGGYDADENERYVRARIVSRLRREYARGLISAAEYEAELLALDGYLPSPKEEGGRED